MTFFEWMEVLAAAASRGDDLEKDFPRVLVCDEDDEEEQK